MSIPFTVDQFFLLFQQYNLAIWPMQIVGIALGLVALAAVIWRPAVSERMVPAVLAAFWIWNGVAYHILFFSEINGLAVAFGVLFVVQAGLFAVYGLIWPTLRFSIRRDVYGLVGSGLVAYAMVVYPLLGMAFGHTYPRAPMFGVAPCPTTIFTFGLLLWAEGRAPRLLLAIPIAWALVGTSAALTLGVPEDFGLTIAGLLGGALLLTRSTAAFNRIGAPGPTNQLTAKGA